jgi:hypothetical protein
MGDFPFFYWYQLIYVPVVAILAGVCYLLLKARRPRGAEAGPVAGGNRRLAK